jgi:serine-type D-Ala-D-Ala carboxypeptidase (penicillin-binding protein 5/6)
MKFLYFLLVTLAFFGSFAIGYKVRAKELGVRTYDLGTVSSLPVMTGSQNFPILSGQGIIAIDGDSNTTLFEKNADTKLLPASTTKIVTAITALDYYKLSDVLAVQTRWIEGQTMGLVLNEKMTFENLLNGLLVYSANDAAIAIADNYPGGKDAFVDAMNAKAQSLHLTLTHFANPIGLDDPNQVTTPRDMVRVAKVAMQNPIFAKIVNTKNVNVSDVTGKFNYSVANVNQLLGTVDGVMGIKTGWTEGAKENLITYVNRDKHPVYIALLGSDDRFGETTQLVNWIYTNYNWQKVDFVQKAVSQIPLSL